MDYKNLMNKIGENISGISTKLFQGISEKFGLDVTSLPIKLLTIIILLAIAYLSLKITNKVLKYLLIILIIIFVISIGFTIFS